MQGEPEKVEFFQSESSFGSESNTSESRYIDFNNELIAEAENIFATLQKEVLPNQALNNTDRLEYALRRAQILHKDSMPEQLNYLTKIAAPQNIQSALANNHRKVGKLLEDYDRLAKGELPYKEFYNTYGKEYGLKDTDFSKKKEHLEISFDQDAVIKPEYIEIAYSGQRHKLRGSTPRVFMGQPNNDKQTTALKEEVYQLKKRLEETQRKNEEERLSQRLIFEKRLKTYLVNISNDEAQNNLKEELKEKSDQCSQLLTENKQLLQIIEEKEKALEAIKDQNTSLKQQIVLLRKTDNNVIEYQDAHNKSYNSQTNEVSADKRNQKRIKNLSQQNDILKNQLKNERQRHYRQQSNLTEDEKRELERNRKALEAKSAELDELYNKFDQQRIQILQLTHNNQSTIKAAESLKRQNQLYKSKIQTLEKSSSDIFPSAARSADSDKPMSVSRKTANKVQIFDYEGDGVQGYQYYQNLSKEFRIRFKRGCLRDKELLYKTNGIEIGVISNFQPPNKISILVHITNYTETAFSRLKAKFINANQNKIQGEEFEQPTLSSNEQVKVPVSLIITQYPLGPMILILEYEVNDKKEEVRILLPAHIFKTMTVQQRNDSIANPTRLYITPERKISKDISDIRGYLKLGKQEGPIRVSLFNEHTHTLLSADIVQNRDGIELCYQHKEGNKKITEYFMKTLAFLLSK